MTDLQIKIERLQNFLNGIATAGIKGKEIEYIDLTNDLLSNTDINKHLPAFLTTNRTANEFYRYIKHKYQTWEERTKYINSEFENVINHINTLENRVINQSTTKTIEKFNQEYISTEWEKAISRMKNDPEGAITTARTLIETTCKCILDSLTVEYEENLDLPKLYKLTAKNLNLAPDQHTEQIFKQILGGCQSIVDGLGSLRNKLSDAHGKQGKQVKPKSRHAQLAVNLAGIMTTFLLQTFEHQQTK